ncbi:MAG: hypothetical protein WA865_12065 [Spirulinaceae cyanobacterium]
MFKDEAVSSGLIVFLNLLLAFVSVRISIPLSIVLGAIAGLCWGFIINWRLTKEEPGEAWSNRLNRVVKTTSGKVNLSEAQRRAREQIKSTRIQDSRNEQNQDKNKNKGGNELIRPLVFWRRKNKN